MCIMSKTSDVCFYPGASVRSMGNLSRSNVQPVANYGQYYPVTSLTGVNTEAGNYAVDLGKGGNLNAQPYDERNLSYQLSLIEGSSLHQPQINYSLDFQKSPNPSYSTVPHSNPAQQPHTFARRPLPERPPLPAHLGVPIDMNAANAAVSAALTGILAGSKPQREAASQQQALQQFYMNSAAASQDAAAGAYGLLDMSTTHGNLLPFAPQLAGVGGAQPQQFPLWMSYPSANLGAFGLAGSHVSAGAGSLPGVAAGINLFNHGHGFSAPESFAGLIAGFDHAALSQFARSGVFSGYQQQQQQQQQTQTHAFVQQQQQQQQQQLQQQSQMQQTQPTAAALAAALQLMGIDGSVTMDHSGPPGLDFSQFDSVAMQGGAAARRPLNLAAGASRVTAGDQNPTGGVGAGALRLPYAPVSTSLSALEFLQPNQQLLSGRASGLTGLSPGVGSFDPNSLWNFSQSAPDVPWRGHERLGGNDQEVMTKTSSGAPSSVAEGDAAAATEAEGDGDADSDSDAPEVKVLDEVDIVSYYRKLTSTVVFAVITEKDVVVGWNDALRSQLVTELGLLRNLFHFLLDLHKGHAFSELSQRISVLSLSAKCLLSEYDKFTSGTGFAIHCTLLAATTLAMEAPKPDFDVLGLAGRPAQALFAAAGGSRLWTVLVKLLSDLKAHGGCASVVADTDFESGTISGASARLLIVLMSKAVRQYTDSLEKGSQQMQKAKRQAISYT